MPIKCESCRFLNRSVIDLCDSPRVQTIPLYYTPLDKAREICDREGDGIFVYFEPKEPSAGVAFATATSPSSPSSMTTPEMALKAAA